MGDDTMLHNVKSGQKVWCIDTFGNIHNAVVNKTVLVKRKNKQITYVRMSEVDGHQNNQGFSIDACYPSREALLEGEKAKSNRQVQLYCEKIQSVNDLVEFMFNNTVAPAEEYTNYDARKAAAIRAEELLGLKLEV